ncbi:PAS domain S-box protein [Methanoplanus sp. FWC-SCC4]|uniref:PAS domain S-box protein n=1 Tax=Methanochimaera problematica TaxID=2609417 RepID=A0AA97FD08_9EURY|nr:methyl-accepting chemotaxis protein [Methanoplanus sp. FWC-SCC4]WOF16617.1 PAS domain S-box protein [Methanoplanus sp. FWC-SCC4]
MEIKEIDEIIKAFLSGNQGKRVIAEDLDPPLRELGKTINSLMESHNFLLQAVMKTPVAMVLFDPNLSVVNVNEELMSLSGYSREDLTKMNISEFTKTFDLQRLEGYGAKDALESKKKMKGKFRMTFQNVNKIIEVNSIPILDDQGNVLSINSAFIDITEIEEKKAWYESILDSIPFPVSVTDLDMNWAYLNPATATMAGVDKKEALGTQCSRWSANICQTQNCGVECLRRGQETTYFEQDGGNFMVNTAWVKDVEGNKAGHVEIIQDITATTRVSEYLEQEVAKIGEDLAKIAAGDPNLSLKVGEADKYTKEVREKFVEISDSIASVQNTLHSLFGEIEKLVEAGIEGKLDVHADSKKYNGTFVDLVENLNRLMESVALPINGAMDVSSYYAKGDFTARFPENISVKGDFETFKNALNNIGIAVSENLAITGNTTKNVVINAEEVTKGADEVSKAVEEVANSSQRASELTRELLAAMEDINHQIADLSASNEEIASTSQEVYNAANHVVEIGKEAQGLANDTNHKMGNVERIAKESVTEIKDLTEKIKEVNNVVKLINNITGQINLLALNAAIEAARAGEHGRGFAVVAGEVKNLAGEARAATDSIEKVVSTVQISSEKTASAITAANEEIIEGVGSVNKTLMALNTIITNAGQVTNDVGEITKAIEDQANVANNVVNSTDKGADMTSKVQKETEELAALAEEASASVEEIGSAMHEVNILIKDLEEANSKFRY